MFDQEFIELARSVYFRNDERAGVQARDQPQAGIAAGRGKVVPELPRRNDLADRLASGRSAEARRSAAASKRSITSSTPIRSITPGFSILLPQGMSAAGLRSICVPPRRTCPRTSGGRNKALNGSGCWPRAGPVHEYPRYWPCAWAGIRRQQQLRACTHRQQLFQGVLAGEIQWRPLAIGQYGIGHGPFAGGWPPHQHHAPAMGCGMVHDAA